MNSPNPSVFGLALKLPALNGWPLFWLIVGPISALMFFSLMTRDLSTGEAVSAMIQLSVRCAVPWLFIAFAASAVQILKPGVFSLWLLRNRKYFGLCFAGAMAWQAFFILWLVTIHREYYVNEVYVLRDALEGLIGYAFLLAMTVTSFHPVRKMMRPRHWKWLHKIGIYSLWMYAYSVYWWELTYYTEPDWIDYVYYLAGFGAWALRMDAWRVKQKKKANRQGVHHPRLALMPVAGFGLVITGLLAVVFGARWQNLSEQLLTGHAITKVGELYIPYWPFEPFLPLIAIASGVYLLTRRP